MSKLFRKLLLGLLLLSGFMILTAPAMAESENYGLNVTAKQAGYAEGETVESSVGKVISALLAILAIAFFVLVTYAGLRWMIARGNEESVMEAKNTLEAAVIGLVVILSAYGLTTFIFNRLESGKVLSGCSSYDTVSACRQDNGCFWNAQNVCTPRESVQTIEDQGICLRIKDGIVEYCGFSSQTDCDDTFYSLDEVITATGNNPGKFCEQVKSDQAIISCAVTSDADVVQYGASLSCGDGFHNVGDVCDGNGMCKPLEGYTLPYNFCKCE